MILTACRPLRLALHDAALVVALVGRGWNADASFVTSVTDLEALVDL